MALNWEEAPADATHGVELADLHGSPWRKIVVEESKVYAWVKNEWVERWLLSFDEYLEINRDCLEERPAPVKAELPNGLQWAEGADFYYEPAGAFFRFDEPAYRFRHEDNWVKLPLVTVQEYANRAWSIHRFPGAQPKAAPKKEEPPKKRAVGWWA